MIQSSSSRWRHATLALLIACLSASSCTGYPRHPQTFHAQWPRRTAVTDNSRQKEELGISVWDDGGRDLQEDDRGSTIQIGGIPNAQDVSPTVGMGGQPNSVSHLNNGDDRKSTFDFGTVTEETSGTSEAIGERPSSISHFSNNGDSRRPDSSPFGELHSAPEAEDGPPVSHEGNGDDYRGPTRPGGFGSFFLPSVGAGVSATSETQEVEPTPTPSEAPTGDNTPVPSQAPSSADSSAEPTTSSATPTTQGSAAPTTSVDTPEPSAAPSSAVDTPEPSEAPTTEPTTTSSFSAIPTMVPTETQTVVELMLRLQIPIPTTVTEAELEQWLCYVDAQMTEQLSRASFDSDLVQLVGQRGALDPTVSTWTLEASGSKKDSHELLADLISVLNVTALNEWLLQDLPQSNALYGATIIDWMGSVQLSSNSKDVFSTAACGTARVSMQFGFFDPLPAHAQLDKLQQDVENVLCASSDYMEGLFTHFYKQGQQHPKQRQKTSLNVTIDRVAWQLETEDPEAAPLTIHFDLKAVEPKSGRRVSPIALLSWMQSSDMQWYIQEAVWNSLPFETSIFHNVNMVNFNGVVRYENQNQGPNIPAQTMSTFDCVAGVYVKDSGGSSQPNRGSSFMTDDSDIMEVTTWTLSFGFDPNYAVSEPSVTDLQGLLCQTYFYYIDIMKPPESAGEDQPYHAIGYTDLIMEAEEFEFAPSDDKPLALHLDVQASFAHREHQKVNPDVLRGKLEQSWDISHYISNYVWKSEPEGINAMFYVQTAHKEGGTRERHVYLPMLLSSYNCTRGTEAPTSYPTAAPSEYPTEHPTVLAPPTEGPTGMPTATGTAAERDQAQNLVGGVIGGIGGIGMGNGNGEPQGESNGGNTGSIYGGIPGLGGGDTPPSREIGPRRDTPVVESSFVVLHLPNVPVDDGSNDEILEDALEEMLNEMISNRPRQYEGGVPLRRRRKLLMEATVDPDSVEVGEITEAACTNYYDVDAYDNRMNCHRVPVQYTVNVAGAESDEDVEAVRADFKNMTDRGIDSGLFQESLDDTSPDSGMLVVPDRESPTTEVPVPPPTTQAPQQLLPQEQPLLLGEREVTPAPTTAGPTPSPLPHREDTTSNSSDDGDDGPPMWAWILIMILLFVVGLVTGLNCHFCFARDRRHSKLDTDERLLMD